MYHSPNYNPLSVYEGTESSNNSSPPKSSVRGLSLNCQRVSVADVRDIKACLGLIKTISSECHRMHVMLPA